MHSDSPWFLELEIRRGTRGDEERTSTNEACSQQCSAVGFPAVSDRRPVRVRVRRDPGAGRAGAAERDALRDGEPSGGWGDGLWPRHPVSGRESDRAPGGCARVRWYAVDVGDQQPLRVVEDFVGLGYDSAQSSRGPGSQDLLWPRLLPGCEDGAFEVGE